MASDLVGRSHSLNGGEMESDQTAASSAADAKRFVSAQELTDLSEDLAFQVARSGFMADPAGHHFMIALWRGGCHTGTVVQEFLEKAHRGVTIDHVAVRTVSRDPATGAPLPEIQVHAAGHATAVLTADTRLLIVDDIWDSGRSIVALLKFLRTALGPKMPRQVRVATVFYKAARNKFLPLQNNQHIEQFLSKPFVRVACFTSSLKLEAARAVHPSGYPRRRG